MMEECRSGERVGGGRAALRCRDLDSGHFQLVPAGQRACRNRTAALALLPTEINRVLLQPLAFSTSDIRRGCRAGKTHFVLWEKLTEQSPGIKMIL